MRNPFYKHLWSRWSIKVKSTTTVELYAPKPNCISRTANPSPRSVQYQRKAKGSPSPESATPSRFTLTIPSRSERRWGRPDLRTAVPGRGEDTELRGDSNTPPDGGACVTSSLAHSWNLWSESQHRRGMSPPRGSSARTPLNHLGGWGGGCSGGADRGQIWFVLWYLRDGQMLRKETKENWFQGN